MGMFVVYNSDCSSKKLRSKKIELKKIYEAGGISKIEYEKAKTFLSKSKETIKEKEKKQSYTLGSKSKKSKKNQFLKKIKNQYLRKI